MRLTQKAIAALALTVLMQAPGAALAAIHYDYDTPLSYIENNDNITATLGQRSISGISPGQISLVQIGSPNDIVVGAVWCVNLWTALAPSGTFGASTASVNTLNNAAAIKALAYHGDKLIAQ